MKLFFLTEGVFEEVRIAIPGTGYILMHIPSNFVQVHNIFSLRYKRIEKFHNANLFENTIFTKSKNFKLRQRRDEIEIISPFCVSTFSGFRLSLIRVFFLHLRKQEGGRVVRALDITIRMSNGEMISISSLRCRNLKFLLFRLCVFAFTISRFNFVFQKSKAKSSRFASLMKLLFLTEGVFEEVRTAIFFFNPLYAFTFLVCDGLNNAFVLSKYTTLFPCVTYGLKNFTMRTSSKTPYLQVSSTTIGQ
jgi:hypothetical protein